MSGTPIAKLVYTLRPTEDRSTKVKMEGTTLLKMEDALNSLYTAPADDD